MFRPASILLYGADPCLVETRCKVLESAGHHATAVKDVTSVAPFSSPTPFDLLMFCHTLGSDDCRRIAGLARARWPGLPILVLSRGPSTKPVALLRMVEEALKKSAPSTLSLVQPLETPPASPIVYNLPQL